MTYTCDHFEIHELVAPETLAQHHEEECWAMFDPDVLKAADWLRERYGPATINNWKWGGEFSQSGLRTPDSKYYSPTSQHSKGCALDMKFKNKTAQQIRDDLAEYQYGGNQIPYFTRVENQVSWLHIDTKPTGQSELYFFNP